ncbi:CHAD domain-containing protein [Candidatus Halobeggiatoa sp. HSG11]|nr:CHAD domain-containing protein [Candidatus Halobeggiatoa sp. HSG11]
MIEKELKLLLNTEDVDKVKQHPLLQQASKNSQLLYSVYFDTVEHDLLRNKIGFRIRHIDERRIQTLKTAGSGVGGLHTRQEWENDITGDTPDYEQIPTDALPYLPANFNTIQPIFTTEFKRITWLININNSVIEIALDQGEVKNSNQSKPISEIELELKSGSEINLYEAALILLDDIPFTIENKSKAAIGYSLCKPQPLKSYKAGSIQFDSTTTAEQAFIHIIWHCLQHLQANEDIVLYNNDIEGVHQMRLALRRLLSGLNLYKTLIPKKSYKKLRQELKWINDVLAVARDWDVLAVNLQPIQPYCSMEELKSKLTTKQTEAYVKVRDMLRSQRYTRTLLLLSKWLLEKSWRNNLEDKYLQHLDNPTTDFANQVLTTRQAAIRCEDITKLNSTQLHDLRIDIKKINYGIRFFVDFYPANIIRPYNKTISHLKDELGFFNDAYVANKLLEQLDLEPKTKHFLTGWYSYQQMLYLDKFKTSWQNFVEKPILKFEA